jgi:hypothetical protein
VQVWEGDGVCREPVTWSYNVRVNFSSGENSEVINGLEWDEAIEFMHGYKMTTADACIALNRAADFCLKCMHIDDPQTMLDRCVENATRQRITLEGPAFLHVEAHPSLAKP